MIGKEFFSDDLEQRVGTFARGVFGEQSFSGMLRSDGQNIYYVEKSRDVLCVLYGGEQITFYRDSSSNE